MMLGQEKPIFDWFIIHFTENNGMAFGMEFGGDVGKTLLTPNTNSCGKPTCWKKIPRSTSITTPNPTLFPIPLPSDIIHTSQKS